MIDKSRDLEYPALGYVFSVAAVDATRSPRSAKSRGLRSVRLNSNGADADF